MLRPQQLFAELRSAAWLFKTQVHVPCMVCMGDPLPWHEAPTVSSALKTFDHLQIRGNVMIPQRSRSLEAEPKELIWLKQVFAWTPKA